MVDQQLTASEVVMENTEAYGRYVITHHFPSAYDGLKKVARRILTSIKPDEELGSDTLVSKTMFLHPHSPESIYQTACRFEEPFSHHFPIFKLRGKGSSYGGDTPSAARYTALKVSDFAVDIFFKGIDFRTISTEIGENLSASEYRYLIPKLPTALLYESETIGFGYSARTSPMKFEDVCELVVDYIQSKDRTNWNGRHLAKLMLPCLPVKLHINNNDELLEQYKLGNFEAAIETEGIYEIVSPTDVLIKTMSYGSSPLSTREKMDLLLRDRNHPLVKEFDVTLDGFSDNRNYADFQLTIKRGANIFKLIDAVRTAMRIRGRFHPVRNYVIDSTMVNLDPAALIKLWYSERYRSLLGTLKYRQQSLFYEKLRVEAYLVICEHVDEVVNKLRTSEEEDFVVWARKRFELSRRQCEILLHANLQVLMKSKRKDLENKAAKLVADIDEVNKSFETIDKDLVKEIQHLKSKYRTDMEFSSRVPSWIGCLIIGDLGIIQIKETDEIFSIGRMFNKPTTFVSYDNVDEIGLSNKSYRIPNLPYTSSVSKIRVSSRNGWFIRSRYSKFQADPVLDSTNRIFNQVSNRAWGISKDGQIISGVKPNQASKLLAMFDGDPSLTYVVLSVNSGYPNVVRLQRLKLTDKLLLMPGGKNEIVGIIPDGTDSSICNMPVDHRWSIIEVAEINRHLAKGNIDDLNINRLQKV